MSAGGITWGVARPILARVVENGVCETDARVLTRGNEAQKLLLDRILPVNGCATYDIVASGQTLLLPKELENALDWEVLGTGKVRGGTDVKEGGYSLVNPFTYVAPDAGRDNPLIDEFLQPDPVTPTILRRKYRYPGLTSGATVRITGAKRFLPLVNTGDYLIIQNLLALKLVIMGVEYIENGKIQEGQALIENAVALLEAEVKKHLLDPMQVMRRKAAYDDDLVSFAQGTYGYTRALLAHMLPNGLNLGKSALSRVLDAAEMRLINKGAYVGCLEVFEADVKDGRLAAPARVGSILTASICGLPLDIRSIFFEYATNGPGLWSAWESTCGRALLDQGEERLGNGVVRRVYKLSAAVGNETAQRLTFVAKLRWVKKRPEDPMVIRNTEALRLMASAVLAEESAQPEKGVKMQSLAIGELERELREYLAGIKHTLQVVTDETNWAYAGGVL